MNKNILIYGAYGEANIGDDMLLHIIIEWLKANNIESNISITSPNVGYIRIMFPYVNIVSKSQSSVLKPQLYILGGGTQFFAFNNSNTLNTKISFIQRLKKLTKKILIYLKKVNQYFNKNNSKSKKIGLGIGLGPFEIYGSELIVESIIAEYDFIYARDSFTNDLCKKFQIPSLLGADICLSDYFYKNYNFKHKKDNLNKEKIGIVLRSWDQNDDGEILNLKTLKWLELNKYNFDIKLFLFSIEKDQKLKDLTNKIEHIHIEIWNPEEDDFDSYLSKLSMMDIIITSRYHAAIFNVNFNIPTICLGIDPKLKYLVDEVDGFYYFEKNEDIEKIDLLINEIMNDYVNLQLNIEFSRLKLNTRANLILKNSERYL